LIRADFPSRWYRTNGGFELALVDDAALADELRAKEIEIALTDLDCRVAVNYQERRDAHIYQVESQWVEDYRADIAALIDATEQRGNTWNHLQNS